MSTGWHLYSQLKEGLLTETRYGNDATFILCARRTERSRSLALLGPALYRSPPESPPPRSSSSMPAVMMPEGKATTATPMSEEIMAMVRPTSEEG